MKVLKIFLLLLVPAMALAAFIAVESGAVPYTVYAVTSGSMTPTIPSKSAVVVRENDYSVGQVITFIANDQTVTHRLISVDADGMATTKGDGNETNDPWQIPTSQIIGGVISAPPQLGYWLVYFKNPLGLASLVLSIIACRLIWAMSDPTSVDVDDASQQVVARYSRAKWLDFDRSPTSLDGQAPYAWGRCL